MIIIMRHAERGDNEFPREHSEISWDPPITKASAQTILQSSEEIAKILIEN